MEYHLDIEAIKATMQSLATLHPIEIKDNYLHYHGTNGYWGLLIQKIEQFEDRDRWVEIRLIKSVITIYKESKSYHITLL